MLKLVQKEEIAYLTSQKLLERSIFLAFTTRMGGHSKSPFYSLNLALNVGDDQNTVIKNRRLIAKKFGFDINKLTCAKQVHGNSAKIISANEVGRGAFGYKNAIDGVDILATDLEGAALSMFYADCLPVVLVGTDPGFISIIHAGYKGLLSGVIKESIKIAAEKTSLSKLLAFTGPSIGSCCYKVGEDRISAFYKKFPEVVKKNDTSLGLKAIARYQLRRSGIRDENIEQSNYCTNCNEDLFYSYRRSKTTGRQAAIAYIFRG